MAETSTQKLARLQAEQRALMGGRKAPAVNDETTAQRQSEATTELPDLTNFDRQVVPATAQRQQRAPVNHAAESRDVVRSADRAYYRSNDQSVLGHQSRDGSSNMVNQEVPTNAATQSRDMLRSADNAYYRNRRHVKVPAAGSQTVDIRTGQAVRQGSVEHPVQRSQVAPRFQVRKESDVTPMAMQAREHVRTTDGFAVIEIRGPKALADTVALELDTLVLSQALTQEERNRIKYDVRLADTAETRPVEEILGAPQPAGEAAPEEALDIDEFLKNTAMTPEESAIPAAPTEVIDDDLDKRF